MYENLVKLQTIALEELATAADAEALEAWRVKYLSRKGGALGDAVKVLGTLPLIAEDLGLITPDVDALRIRFDLPGMRVLQFMLGGPENPYWPHMYQPNTVVYSGTHDNDTTAGWYATLGLEERKRLDDYVGHAVREPHWELLRLAWGSVAKLAIAPCQDWLGLDGTARMNVPGVADGNWGWRLRPEDFGPGAIERLAALTERTARVVPVPA